jgi:hypothetical protein
MNGDVSFKDAIFGVETNHQVKYLYRAHKSIIESSQLDDEFEPIDMPNPPRHLRARLLDDYDIKRLETFFLMFIGDEQFDLLARNTKCIYCLPVREPSRKA